MVNYYPEIHYKVSDNVNGIMNLRFYPTSDSTESGIGNSMMYEVMDIAQDGVIFLISLEKEL